MVLVVYLFLIRSLFSYCVDEPIPSGDHSEEDISCFNEAIKE